MQLCKLCGTAWWVLFQSKCFAPEANLTLNKEITKRERKYLA
jgi:hypothetical protein